jgi:L-alanine-DL-glutamate epimerase-like enolase superfamily enzyme
MIDSKDFVITDVEAIPFEFQSSTGRGFGHTHPTAPHPQRQVLLKIRTASGAEGYAFGIEPSFVTGVLEPRLVGLNALYREDIWQQMSELQRGSGSILSDSELAAIDIALWDLLGRAVGLPVYQLLGAFRDRIPAYASTMCGDSDLPGGLVTVEDYADFAEACLAEGYKALKLHTWMPPTPGAPSVDRDIALCQGVRDRVGTRMDLMLDPYHYYSRQDAKRLGRAAQDLGFLWIEEPMREASTSSYRWLADQLDIDVVGPETAGGQIWTRAEWVRTGAADVLRGGVLDLGGITPLMKVVHLAEANGMSVEIHQSGAANLQVLGAMAIPGRYYERGLLHPLLDYSARTPWLAELQDPLDEDGYVSVPQHPGVGWVIDWDFIHANEIK